MSKLHIMLVVGCTAVASRRRRRCGGALFGEGHWCRSTWFLGQRPWHAQRARSWLQDAQGRGDSVAKGI